tara:strand:+ start:445 stop:600 length:156 start_codon:yes stop_codon:yes gene_type:complete
MNNKEHISRKQAIGKISKYTALTALGTFLILSPQKAQAASAASPDNPGTGF